MAKLSATQPRPRRGLRAALLLVRCWLTYAVFNKTFVDSCKVDADHVPKVGLQLPKRADVKIRGVIVGEVRSMASDGDGAALDSRRSTRTRRASIPSNVTARILPKTLFGEKYVELEIPEDAPSRADRGG